MKKIAILFLAILIIIQFLACEYAGENSTEQEVKVSIPILDFKFESEPGGNSCWSAWFKSRDEDLSDGIRIPCQMQAVSMDFYMGVAQKEIVGDLEERLLTEQNRNLPYEKELFFDNYSIIDGKLYMVMSSGEKEQVEWVNLNDYQKGEKVAVGAVSVTKYKCDLLLTNETIYIYTIEDITITDGESVNIDLSQHEQFGMLIDDLSNGGILDLTNSTMKRDFYGNIFNIEYLDGDKSVIKRVVKHGDNDYLTEGWNRFYGSYGNDLKDIIVSTEIIADQTIGCFDVELLKQYIKSQRNR